MTKTTIAQVINLDPQAFANESPARIQDFITWAESLLDPSFFGNQHSRAVALLTAHLLTELPDTSNNNQDDSDASGMINSSGVASVDFKDDFKIDFQLPGDIAKGPGMEAIGQGIYSTTKYGRLLQALIRSLYVPVMWII